MADIHGKAFCQDNPTSTRNHHSKCIADEKTPARSIQIPESTAELPSLNTDRDDDDDDDDDTQSISHQTNILPTKLLLIAFPALSVSLFVSFFDQTSVSTAIPAISAELETGAATSWIGASFLIASTTFQLINGRLSDIFGRKRCLLACLALLGFGDLLCGFAQNKEMLFVFRSIAGIGAGGINSIAMIIVSDVTTLEKRGKYQGILGSVIALANGVGPFIGGVLVQKATWRWVFWVVPLQAIPAAIFIYFFLPLKYAPCNTAEMLTKIDYAGIALNIVAVLLTLIPLAGGGVTYPWNSPMVISMIVLGAATAIVFVLYEWRIARIPIMPLHLFKAPHCGPLYLQNAFVGIAFFGNFFYSRLYFQMVLSYSPLKSGAVIMALVVLSSIGSVLSGLLMARFNAYLPILLTGHVVWNIGTALKCTFARDTQLWFIILTLLIEGLGIGFTLQPTLVAILANSHPSDRGVCTGLRNFIRTLSGALSVVVSGVILSNTLRSRLLHLPFITKELIISITSSTYDLNRYGFAEDQKTSIKIAYMAGIKYIFIMYAAGEGLNLLLCLGIGKTRLKRKETVSKEEEGSGQDG